MQVVLESGITGILMAGLYIHDIDPVIVDAGGVVLWYYGLFYALGFLGVFLWLKYHAISILIFT